MSENKTPEPSDAKFNAIKPLIKESDLEDSPKPPTCDEDNSSDMGNFPLDLHNSKTLQQSVVMSQDHEPMQLQCVAPS
jgi:hypothetical protein